MVFWGTGGTDLGLMRENNEDSFFITNDSIGVLPHLFIVADGIGGSRAGEVASRKAVEYFCAYIRNSEEKDVLKLFFDAVQYANKKVYGLSLENPDYSEMGTTFIAAVVTDNELNYVHIGDSRIYLSNEAGIRLLTEDHTLSNQMIKSGLMPSDNIEIVNKNALVRWVGAKGEVEPDLKKIGLCGGDTVLICSDGLSNMLSEDEMLCILRSGDDKSEKVTKLILRAKENGGKDNITVILI